MDKIGEAIKPLTTSFLDLLEVERRKKEDNDQTMMVCNAMHTGLGEFNAVGHDEEVLVEVVNVIYVGGRQG